MGLTKLYDLMAMLSPSGDSPYPYDPNDELKYKVQEYRNQHPEEFVFIKDWLNHLHFKEVAEVTDDFDRSAVIFSTKYKSINDNSKISDFPVLSDGVKNFFNNYGKSLGCSDDVMIWASDAKPIESTILSSQTDETKEVEKQEVENNSSNNVSENNLNTENNTDYGTYDDIIPDFQSDDSYLSDGSNYNYSSNIMLTYEELANICLNQAKQSLVSHQIRTAEVEKIKNERRNDIIADLNKYLEMTEMAAIYDNAADKFDKMSLDQLEIYQKQFQRKYDSFKTREFIKDGAEGFQFIYKSIFPNGVPLGKTRYWKVDDGVLDEINRSLFDTRKVTGQAFSRILDAHPLHIPNGVTVAVAIGKQILMNSKLIKREDVLRQQAEDENKKSGKKNSNAKIEELDSSYSGYSNYTNDYSEDTSYSDETIKSVDFAH